MMRSQRPVRVPAADGCAGHRRSDPAAERRPHRLSPHPGCRVPGAAQEAGPRRRIGGEPALPGPLALAREPIGWPPQVPIEYLEELHARHDEWLLSGGAGEPEAEGVPVLVLDGTADAVAHPRFYDELREQIEAKLAALRARAAALSSPAPPAEGEQRDPLTPEATGLSSTAAAAEAAPGAARRIVLEGK